MKRIGLYLGAAPGGGTFQYNQAMLDAVSALPDNLYSTVVVYSEKQWDDYFLAYDLVTIYIERGFVGRAIGRVFRQWAMLDGVWRRISPWFLPVARVMLKCRCDLWIIPSQDGLCFQAPIAALEVVHDLMHRYEPQFPEVSENGEYERREKHYSAMCRWANGVLVDSEVGRDQLVESYAIDPNKVFVLPFIAPNYMSQENSPDGFEQRYQLPDKYLFYPAQFWQHKNHQRLIKALDRLTDLPEIQLVLVGAKKNGYLALIDLIKQLDLSHRVHFLGYVPDQDMPELYRRARAMIMPTFFGPTNIPPLEAFSVGCPAAVSRIYGMPKQVGDAALLFDPKSVQEIAITIRRLWTDDSLCSVLSNNGKLRVAAWGRSQFNFRLADIIESSIASD